MIKMQSFISKILICTIVITISFASVGLAHADTIPQEKQPFDVSQLVNGIANAGYDVEIESQNDSHIEYCIDVNINGKIVQSSNKVEQLSDGSIRLECTEVDKKDVVIFETDGSVTVNGSKVIVETSDIKGGNTNFEEKPVLRGRHYNVMTTACPYGSSSDYTTLYGSPKKTVLTFQQAISNFTVGALAGIVVGLVLSGVGAGAGVAIAGALISSGISSVIGYFTNNKPSARAMSSITKVYTHKNKGAYIGNGLYVYKHVVRYYATTNYTTPITSSTVYNKIQV